MTDYKVNIVSVEDPETPEDFVRICAVVLKDGLEVYSHTAAIPKAEYSKEIERCVAEAAINKVIYTDSLKETPEDDPEEKE